jgi:hypothetical protein
MGGTIKPRVIWHWESCVDQLKFGIGVCRQNYLLGSNGATCCSTILNRNVGNLHDALTDMMACVPGRSERLYEYVYRKLAFIHKLKLPINDEDKVNLIMGGINNDQVKFSVGMAGITDPHELANHLKLCT